MRSLVISVGLGAVAALAALAACGDNTAPPLRYTDPGAGKLRLIQGPGVGAGPQTSVVLQLVVGDAPLTGYSVGFDLPLDDAQVALAGFTAGTALAPGTAPAAALGTLSSTGPLAHQLVTGQSQKASGGGAVPTNTTLAPGTVLYAVQLELRKGAAGGVVFDGTAHDFVLRSGGMRDRAGTTVVSASDVAIGKLEANP